MPFELPENLDQLSVADLQALIDAGLDAFRTLDISDASPDDVLAEGERIAPLITRAREALRVAEAHAVGRRDRISNLVNVVEAQSPQEPPDPPPDPNAPPPESTATETVAPAPAPAPAAEPAPAAVETVTPELVPASAAPSRQSPARRAAANATTTVAAPPRTPAVATLTAAADVPGIPTGAPLDGLDAVCAAVMARMRALPTGRIGSTPIRNRYGAATIRLGGFDDLSQDAKVHDDYGLVWAAGSEARLPGGSLTAAGGWCAPSETLYDLCQFETVDGILDAPEVNITRGGIRWTPGPDFSDIYDACGFFLTEAEAIAGTAQKDCCMVECPPFDEIRLDAIGLCVKTPLLTNSAYPELVRRFMEGALVAQQHKVNKYVLDTMAASTGAPVVLDDAGALTISMEMLELLAVGMRYRYRMSQTQTIEVVLPFWVKPLIRGDLGRRAFNTNRNISDAELDGWFSSRNMHVQWVYDWQDLAVDLCAVTVPATVDALMYPAGTWVRGRADVINIDAVYDSAGLAENVFTALFMEEGILAVQRCTHTCLVTIPICVSGRTAAADITECATFPSGGGGVVAATGATAGIPGTFTPSGSTPPASPAAMTGLTASPNTAWTTGQYVQTGTAGAAGRSYWNGTAWTQGAAP